MKSAALWLKVCFKGYHNSFIVADSDAVMHPAVPCSAVGHVMWLCSWQVVVNSNGGDIHSGAL